MTISRDPNAAGLTFGTDDAGDEFYEIGYATGEAVWPRARVRIVRKRVVPAMRANIPLASPIVTVHVSVSLVDAAGQVLTVAGWGLVGEARGATWQSNIGMPLTPVAWIDGLAADGIALAIAWANDMVAAADADLLTPPAETPSPAAELVPSAFGAPAVAPMVIPMIDLEAAIA